MDVPSSLRTRNHDAATVAGARHVPVSRTIPETRASPNRAVPLLSTVMLLAIIVTTTCQLRTGVARDMRT